MLFCLKYTFICFGKILVERLRFNLNISLRYMDSTESTVRIGRCYLVNLGAYCVICRNTKHMLASNFIFIKKPQSCGLKTDNETGDESGDGLLFT